MSDEVVPSSNVTSLNHRMLGREIHSDSLHRMVAECLSYLKAHPEEKALAFSATRMIEGWSYKYIPDRWIDIFDEDPVYIGSEAFLERTQTIDRNGLSLIGYIKPDGMMCRMDGMSFF